MSRRLSAARVVVAACVVALVAVATPVLAVEQLSSPSSASLAVAQSNPPLSCSSPTLYNIESNGNFYALNDTTLANAAAAPSTIGSGTRNALGISGNGTTAYSANMTVSGTPATTTISVEDIASGTNTTYNAMTAAGASEIIAGGVNPVNGKYYYGGWNSAQNTLYLFAFDPGTHTSTAIGTIARPTNVNYQYGDLAFDGSGDLYVLAGTTSANTAALLVVSAAGLPSSGTGAIAYSKLTTLTSTTNQNYLGIAFAADSQLYVETIQAELYKVNPNDGTITDLGKQTGITSPTDLASCSYNGSIKAQKDVVGRVAPGDQFTMTITGGGISSGNTGTTSGTSDGVQTGAGEVAGPVVGLPGTSYTLTETPASGSGANLADYQTTYVCMNGSTTVASGSGATTTFTFPSPSGNAGAAVVCTFTNTPAALSIAKTSPTPSVSKVGDTVGYSFAVKNTGPLTLTDVGVADLPVAPAGGLSAGPTCTGLTSPAATCTGSTTTLAPGQTATFTGSYAVTQADLDNGTVNDTAKASGTAPGGGTVTATSNQVTVPVTQSPALTITKSASPPAVSKPGDVVTYTFVVHNGGNVTVGDVTVHDAQSSPSGALISGPACANPPSTTCADGAATATLAPGQSATFTATYATTQADLDHGSIKDSAYATGTTSLHAAVESPPATASVGVKQAAGIALTKTASIASFSKAGTPVTYSYAVTNTGNVTLDPVTVTDPMTGLTAITCPGTTLSPGATETCTAGYTTSQSDLDAGSVSNTGTASGTPPSGPSVTATSSATISGEQVVSVALLKSAAPTSFDATGTTITYSYKVTDDGNVTLDPVTVTDPMKGLTAITCPGTTLSPGATETCTASYITTQADLDAGSVSNTGTAHGTGGGKTVTAVSSATVAATRTPHVSITKSAEPTSFSDPGTVITYSYALKNTGNVTLDPVTVTDPMPGLSKIDCPQTSLAPNAAETCTASYTTTQADLDAGSVSNTGTASGQPPSGPPVTAASSATVQAKEAPGVTIKKSASMTTFSAPGATVTYSYLVKNAGNVTLHDVVVSDPMAGLSAVDCPEQTLAPGATVTCTATYKTTQADVDHGSISNTGTVTADPPQGSPVSDSSALTVQAAPQPGISVVKTASVSSVSAPGQQVTYTFVLTNTGNVTLSGVDVTDAQTAPSLDLGLSDITCATGTNGSITLAPGASDTCQATYTVTPADLANGSVADTATVRGDPPGEQEPVTGSSSVTLSVTGMTVTKSASPAGGVVAGSQTPIVYTITVTNNGTADSPAQTVVTDTAPTGTTLVTGSAKCTGGPPTCTATVSGSTVTWTIPAGVGPGASYTLVFSVTANAGDAAGTIANTATWTGPGCGTPGVVSAPCTTDPPTSTPVTAPATSPSTTPTTSGGTGSTAPVTASPVTAASTTSASTTVAFTGALLSQEWIAGATVLVLGVALMLLARWRRRIPRHLASKR